MGNKRELIQCKCLPSPRSVADLINPVARCQEVCAHYLHFTDGEAKVQRAGAGRGLPPLWHSEVSGDALSLLIR